MGELGISTGGAPAGGQTQGSSTGVTVASLTKTPWRVLILDQGQTITNEQILQAYEAVISAFVAAGETNAETDLDRASIQDQAEARAHLEEKQQDLKILVKLLEGKKEEVAKELGISLDDVEQMCAGFKGIDLPTARTLLRGVMVALDPSLKEAQESSIAAGAPRASMAQPKGLSASNPALPPGSSSAEPDPTERFNLYMLPSLTTLVFEIMTAVTHQKMSNKELDRLCKMLGIENMYEWAKSAAQEAIRQGKLEAAKLIMEATAQFIQGAVSIGMAVGTAAMSIGTSKTLLQEKQDAQSNAAYYQKSGVPPAYRDANGNVLTQQADGKWYNQSTGSTVDPVTNEPYTPAVTPNNPRFYGPDGKPMNVDNFMGQDPPPGLLEVKAYRAEVVKYTNANPRVTGTDASGTQITSTDPDPVTMTKLDGENGYIRGRVENVRRHDNMVDMINNRNMAQLQMLRSIGDALPAFAGAITKLLEVGVEIEKAKAQAQQIIDQALKDLYSQYFQTASSAFDQSTQSIDAIMQFLQSFSQNITRLVFRG